MSDEKPPPFGELEEIYEAVKSVHEADYAAAVARKVAKYDRAELYNVTSIWHNTFIMQAKLDTDKRRRRILTAYILKRGHAPKNSGSRADSKS